MEEMLDLLNENGDKIGTVEKSEAHKKGLWHRVVHIWILNSKNELLIQKRCSQKSFYPNVWDVSVGGHVGVCESSISLQGNNYSFSDAKELVNKIMKINSECIKPDITEEYIDLLIQNAINENVPKEENLNSKIDCSDTKNLEI